MNWPELNSLLQDAPFGVPAKLRRIKAAADQQSWHAAVRDLSAELGAARGDWAIALAASNDGSARRLALELGRRTHPTTGRVRRALRPLFADRAISLRLRAASATALAKHASHRAVVHLFRALAAGLGRSRAVFRLDALADRLGHPMAVAEVRAELLNRQHMRCPRCGVQRRRRRMIRHLWNHHQLLLEGRRAQTPIQSLDARMATQDGPAALITLHREMLARGLRDDEACNHLCHEAGERRSSLCPNCFTFNPSGALPIAPAETSWGRIATSNYSVTIGDRGLCFTLDIVLDDRTVFAGAEPGQSYTTTAWSLLAMCWAGAALMVAVLAPAAWAGFAATIALLPVVGALYRARNVRANAQELLDRAVDHAWRVLAPELTRGEDLARLALASVNRGDANSRRAILDEKLVNGPSTAQAALIWLKVHDDEDSGRDPLRELVDRLADAFHGRLPVFVANELLTRFNAERRSRAERERLRVRGCEQAFAAGLGVWDLAELGRAFPDFADVFRTSDVDGLARLRLVWERRPTRPWMKCGPAITVFELARYPVLGGEALAAAPDLLLFQLIPPHEPGRPAEPLALCGRGLVIRGVVLRERPENIIARPRESWLGDTNEIRLDSQRVRCEDDPSPLAERLRQWTDFAFDEFLPQVDSVLRYRASDRLHALLHQCSMTCATCAKSFVPVVGRVGFAAP